MRRAVYTALVGVLAFIGVLATPSEVFKADNSDGYVDSVNYDVIINIAVLENGEWITRGSTGFFDPDNYDYLDYFYIQLDRIDHESINARFDLVFYSDWDRPSNRAFLKGYTYEFNYEFYVSSTDNSKTLRPYMTYMDVLRVDNFQYRSLEYANIRTYEEYFNQKNTVSLAVDNTEAYVFSYYFNIHDLCNSTDIEAEIEVEYINSYIYTEPYYYTLPSVPIPDINVDGLVNLNDFVLPTGLLSVLLVPFNQEFFLAGACLTLTVGVGAFMLFRGKGNK